MQAYRQNDRVRANKNLNHGIERGRMGTVTDDSPAEIAFVDVHFDNEPAPLGVAKDDVDPLQAAAE